MNASSRSQILPLALLLLGASPLRANESAPTADRPAKLVATVTPAYPYLMRHAGATAEVTVSFTVNSKGVVTKAAVVDSNNFEFNASTLDAIKRWTFTPATRDGQAVETKLRQTFAFSVQEPTVIRGTPVLLAGTNSK